VIRARKGETPNIASSGYFPGTVIVANSSYLVIEGLEISNAAGIALNVQESDHVTIRGCHIHDALKAAAYVRGDFVTLEGNDIHDTAKSQDTSCVTSVRHADHRYAKGMIVRSNHVYRCGGECIDNWYGEDALTERNVVHDCRSAGIYNDHARNVRIERNLLYWTDPAFDNPLRAGNRAMAIQLAAEPPFEPGGTYGELANIIVANNVIVGWGWGISYWNSGNTTSDNTFHDVTIANNVVYATKSDPLHLDAPPAIPPKNVRIANNVFEPAEGVASGELPTTGISYVTNDWPKGVPAAAKGDLAVAPAFASPSSNATTADAFKLQSSSPLRHVGTSMAEVTTDFWCAPRAAKPSIGVHEPD
jgi:hypothetical protein